MRRLVYILLVFAASAAAFALLKVPFLWRYASLGEVGAVIFHGLSLDLTVAGYVTVVPLLAVLVSFWWPVPRWVLYGYFGVTALFAGAVYAGNWALYGYWGFPLDSSVLQYLSTPAQALASSGLGEILGGFAAILFTALLLFGMWFYLTRRFWASGRSLAGFSAGLGLMLPLFLAIRGGMSVATANVAQVYFSDRTVLNHAAVNPLFSLLSSLGKGVSGYPFFPEEERASLFDQVRGREGAPSERLLTCTRPNVVVILLESFSRAFTDAVEQGREVTPCLNRLKSDGVWFENFYANSFRTDRGEVAVLSGFPAQTTMSIMKLPRQSASLPSLARSLGEQGYKSIFMYGGDLNFTNQAAYMYATGWQELVWQKQMHIDAPTSKWGYADDVVCALFADKVESLPQPFLAGLLTLSSHEPFEVPGERVFEDKILNAVHFTDAQIGLLIDRLRASALWENTVVVLVADHGFPYPRTVTYNSPERHRIPMLWVGGALRGSRVITDYASQIDLAATLLSQMEVPHSGFEYSKDLFGAEPPARFGYWCFSDGFGIIDRTGYTIYDHTSGRVTGTGTLLDQGKALLQTTYEDISAR